MQQCDYRMPSLTAIDRDFLRVRRWEGLLGDPAQVPPHDLRLTTQSQRRTGRGGGGVDSEEQ
ncbi:hypothetical protein ACE1SV_43040 [Streptomyces sennicomposti]